MKNPIYVMLVKEQSALEKKILEIQNSDALNLLGVGVETLM